MLPRFMTRPYGKISRTTRRDPPAAPTDLQINITGRHTLEQLSMELQVVIARLQEAHAYGVQNVRIRLEPTDKQGERITLFDQEGKPVQLMRVPELPPEPPYRPE
jgi:hypothetical protein